MIPFVARKTPFGQYVSKLVLGVNIFDLNFGVHTDSVEQPIMRNSLGSGHVSHCWTPSFDNHLDDGLRCLRKCAPEDSP